MKRITISLILFLFFYPWMMESHAQISRALPDEEKTLWKSLKKETGFKKVFKKYKNYRFEIIYTKIDRDNNGGVKLTNFHLGDSASYFYPASIAKLPLAICISEKMGEEPFLNLNLAMKLRIDTAKICKHQYENGMYEYHRVQWGDNYREIAMKYRISFEDLLTWNNVTDTTLPKVNTTLMIYHRKSRPTLSDLLSEMLIYSDNESYNKLFEVAGGNIVNDWLEEKGFAKSNVSRKFLFCEGEEKSYALPYDILNDRDIIFYHCKERQWSLPDNSKITGIKVGKKYYWNDSLIKEGKSFADHNCIPLNDAHTMLQRLIFPSVFTADEQYEMNQRNYRNLIKYLGMYPREDVSLRDSCYDNLDDGEKVFLWKGHRRKIQSDGILTPELFEENIRVINIIGQSYGFSTDVMYFTDSKTNTEFFLSVRIYTNKDEILNDDKYEYDEIAIPLMESLGTYFHEMEKKREKTFLPNFALLNSLFD